MIKPNTYIFDIDHTIAEHIGRSPYDYDSSINDQPIYLSCDILNMIINNPDNIVILLTGRPERARQVTIKWLEEQNIFYHYLIMKQGNEYQKSAETKLNSIKELQKNFNIKAIFEDSQRCIDAYKELGITIFQVHLNGKTSR